MKSQYDIYEKVKNYPWENEYFVAEYLAQTYFYVSHSEKLLCLAMARLDDDKIFRRFKEHLNEESAHDKLAIRDLQRFGSNIESHQEHSLTKAFYQGQYYQIEYKHPLALMGYIFFLEDLVAKAGPYVHEKISASSGKISSFIKLHYEEDEDHVEEARKLIESLPKNIQNFIAENKRYSQEIFFNILDAIEANIEKQDKTAA
ncbi:iron-containing redox enzyme family protein [Halobacteriovorax sp. GFR7]|uniref:iron-containing redox enzyme family protein n=1 Tax=unclassified Halobacteriovorax TaxID=2639665 RepID=UPI003D973483